MSKVASTYVQNHRQQFRMLASGVGVVMVLAFGQSSERALFPLGQVSAPTSFAAIAEPVQPEMDVPRPHRAAFIARPRSARALPGLGQNTPPPPIVLALSEPDALFPISDMPPESIPGLGDSANPPISFQRGPLAGSSPPRFGAGAPQDTVPGVPEPGTWLTMIVGFFVVGSSLRIGRRIKSVEFKPVPSEAD